MVGDFFRLHTFTIFVFLYLLHIVSKIINVALLKRRFCKYRFACTQVSHAKEVIVKPCRDLEPVARERFLDRGGSK